MEFFGSHSQDKIRSSPNIAHLNGNFTRGTFPFLRLKLIKSLTPLKPQTSNDWKFYHIALQLSLVNYSVSTYL